jgi:hypothetical protein
VVRVQQFLDKRGSYIGGFASYMRQANDFGREAQTYAVDGIFRSMSRSTTIKGSVAMSDAGNRNADSEDGWRGYLSANRRWNNGLSIDFEAINASRAYDPNDMGYLSRPDEQTATVSVSKHMDHRWWIVRNYTGTLGATETKDQAGVTTGTDVQGRMKFNFMNFWYLIAQTGVKLSAYDDRELRTFNDPVKKYLKTEDCPYFNIYGDTSMNKPYYVSVQWVKEWYEGGPADYYTVNQTVKPHSALEVQLGSNYTRSKGMRRYMETQQGIPITGLRRLSQFNQTLRISYAIDPNFTVQFFSQWLAGTWDYRDFKRYVDDDTLADFASPSYTADSARNWTVNLITRWEFRPGSTAYLVYTRGVSTNQLISQNASLRPWNDLSILKDLPSDDVVQLKVSWLFR